MFKACPFNICKRFLQSFLIHVSVLWGVFQPAFCHFSKVLFMQMFKTCSFNICKRFVAKFFVALVPIVSGFNPAFSLFSKVLFPANVQNVSV